jgi:rhodanese-related sulfurtransferase
LSEKYIFAMKTSHLVLVAVAAASKRHGTAAFAPRLSFPRAAFTTMSDGSSPSLTRRHSSRLFAEDSRSAASSDIRVVGKADLRQILQDLEDNGRDGSGFCVMDVRQPEEIAATGKISPSVLNLPLPLILEEGILSKTDEEFQEIANFPKPSLDETLVFSCAAGMRSTRASLAAAEAGYTNIINYSGGANDWFSS